MPVPAKLTTGVFDPLHMVTLASGLATGVGFAVIVNCCVLPEQLTPALAY